MFLTDAMAQYRVVQEPMLASLWQENFKVQIESRTGALHLHIPGTFPYVDVCIIASLILSKGEPPSKRRKLGDAKKSSDFEVFRDQEVEPFGNAVDFGMYVTCDFESPLIRVQILASQELNLTSTSRLEINVFVLLRYVVVFLILELRQDLMSL